VGRGTLASGHPSFPLLIVAVPVLFAERLTSAFAALHPEWGNNTNSNLFLPPFLKRPALSAGVNSSPPAANVLTLCKHRSNFGGNLLQPSNPGPKSDGIPLRSSPLTPSTADENSLIFRNALAPRTAAIAIINAPLYRLDWRTIQGVSGCLFRQFHPVLLPFLKQTVCQTKLPEKSAVTHISIMQFIHCSGIICTLAADHYAKIT
jgi:hypothetical protein